MLFSVNNSSKIRRISGNENINEADDLLIKAGILLQEYTNSDFGVDISIEKKIPMGGGLGGGSSNAATVLLALNQLWQTKLDLATLQKLGRKLGADVPIFIHNHSAWASGTGDKLTSLLLPNFWFLVVHPGINVNTKAVFNHPSLNFSKPLVVIPSIAQLANTHNDCLDATLNKHPEVALLLDWFKTLPKTIPNWQENLVQGLEKPRMSGTGASVFIALKNRDLLDIALKACPSQWQGFVAQGINKNDYFYKKM